MEPELERSKYWPVPFPRSYSRLPESQARYSVPDAIVAVASDAAILRSRELSDPQQWLWHLSGTHHIARQLGESGFLSETFQVYPCPSFRLDVVHGDDWAAIGDSAQSYAPISAQGIYKAVSSGIQIAKLMAGLNGDLTAYGDFVDRQYPEYLNLRKALYAREQRWVKSPFWSTRHAIKPD